MAHVFRTSAASDGIRKKPREHGPLSVILLGLLAFSRGFVNIFLRALLKHSPCIAIGRICAATWAQQKTREIPLLSTRPRLLLQYWAWGIRGAMNLWRSASVQAKCPRVCDLGDVDDNY